MTASNKRHYSLDKKKIVIERYFVTTEKKYRLS